MAVRKTKSQEVEVEVTPEVEVLSVTEDTPTAEVETPEIVVEVPAVEVVEPEVKESEVEVDLAVTEAKRPSGLVKIRMRVDHKCCIAMERYDLKAGKTYSVPENVKRILNKAGLLAPL